MLLDRNKHNESAYIGEELFSDPQKDHLHKCVVVEQTITDGDFSLDEALDAYHVSKEEYENYIARKSNANIFISISGSATTYPAINMNYAMPVYIDVVAKMIASSVDEIERSFDEQQHTLFDHRLNKIKDELQQISRELQLKA